MTILHRYILKQLLRNLGVSLAIFCMLFLISDFFDRIDNVIGEQTTIWTIALYFLLKVPIMVGTTFPIAMLVAVLLTIGLLSKNSEITAMRSAGLPVLWILRPVIGCGLVMSLVSLLLNETIVPFCARRVNEIYNIDIKHRDERGAYDQANFWWRSPDAFYSVSNFDSRSNRLVELTKIEIDSDARIIRRTNAQEAHWLDPLLGWSMSQVSEHRFDGETPQITKYKSLPLPIREQPTDFYEAETDPQAMSFRALRKFMKRQRESGLPINEYLADYYAKFSFPFVIFLLPFLVAPFAMKPGRNTSMAVGFLAGLVIGLSYYAVHSLSLALGRADIWHPMLAAWTANVLMALVGAVLQLGAESPS